MIAATAAILLVWLNCIEIYARHGHDQSHLDAVLATVIQTTSAVGGISLALVFLTAQLAASKTAVLRELYRGGEVYLLLGCIVGTLCGGYLTFVMFSGGSVTDLQAKCIDTVLICGLSSIVLVAPVLLLQIENLDPVTLTAKLADRVTIADVLEYGLSRVETRKDGSVASFGLNVVGIRPRSVDPLRPVHEIIMQAVTARDRVLLGKLYRCLMRPVVRAYGAAWSIDGTQNASRQPPLVPRFGRSRTEAERLHVALTILHYVVKRARNLRTEWTVDGTVYDIGRHGAITVIGDLISALAPIKRSGVAIYVALYAARRISEVFADVRPFGRIEPFADYFSSAELLRRHNKLGTARFCLAVLAWVRVNTLQLADDRVPLQAVVPATLVEEWASALAAASAGEVPVATYSDPWGTWLR